MSERHEQAMTDSIELLMVGADGHAVEGPRIPRPTGNAVCYVNEDFSEQLAYRHKFFRRDEHGQPVEGALVEFYVPAYLCAGASPSARALELVAQRMGWKEG
jgi:hypothetical protein